MCEMEEGRGLGNRLTRSGPASLYDWDSVAYSGCLGLIERIFCI